MFQITSQQCYPISLIESILQISVDNTSLAYFRSRYAESEPREMEYVYISVFYIIYFLSRTNVLLSNVCDFIFAFGFYRFQAIFGDGIDTVKGEADDLEKEIGICPVCNTPVLEKRFEYACATPECFKVGKHIKGKTIIPSMVKDLLQNGQTGWIKGFHGKKGAYTAKILFKNGKIEFEFPEQRHR